MKNKKCFVSYAHVDREIVQNQILPVLEELGVNIWLDQNEIDFGESIFDSILNGIRNVDFVIALFNGQSTYVNFEIGTAIGQSKPVIAILNEKYNYPSDVRNLNYITYKENDKNDLSKKLRKALQSVEENVIDKLDFAFSKDKKLIGIQIGTQSSNFEEELRITADLIQFLKEISGTSEIDLVQTSKGSLKSLLSIDFKSWVELLEKIIFIVPELKKRRLERDRMKAETKQIESKTQIDEKKSVVEIKKIDADTAKSIAETSNILTDIKHKELDITIKQANAFLDIMERGQKLGLKVQFDHELIFLEEFNILKIKKPEGDNN